MLWICTKLLMYIYQESGKRENLSKGVLQQPFSREVLVGFIGFVMGTESSAFIDLDQTLEWLANLSLKISIKDFLEFIIITLIFFH